MGKPKVNEAAAIHLAKGVLEDQDVPVGRHELGGAKVMIEFPADAQVERYAGTAGDGFDFYTKGLSSGAAVAFARLASEELTSAKRLKLWRKAIATAAQSGDQKLKYPDEALEALKETEPGQEKRKTQAKRHVDRAGVKVTVIA